MDSWISMLNVAGGAWWEAVLRSCWQGAAAVALVWLLCRFRRGIPAAMRCWLWWAACAKLVLALVWFGPAPVRLPVLPASERAAKPAPGGDRTSAVVLLASIPGDRSAASSPAERAHSVEIAFTSPRLSLEAALLGCWLLGVLVQAAFSVRRLRATRRLLRSARPVSDPEVLECAAGLAVRTGIARLPLLLESPELQGPLVTGLLRTRVLLPAPVRERLAGEELRMAMAHELAHVRRRDLWYGLVPELARILLFFFPPAWLACREWALSREADCDRRALEASEATVGAYGRLLLKLSAPGATPVPMAALGVGAGYSTLKRRLLMLRESRSNSGQGPGHGTRARRRGLRTAPALLFLAGALCALPWQVVAQDAVDRRGRLAQQWEDVLLLNALRYLRLQPGQMQQMLGLSRTAEARMARLRMEEERTEAQVERIAQRQREALVSGGKISVQEQSDALTLGRVMKEKRAGTEEELVRELAPKLARILAREQVQRAYTLAHGQTPEGEAPRPALLDPPSGFVVTPETHQQWRQAAIRHVLGRKYPPALADWVAENRPTSLYLLADAAGSVAWKADPGQSGQPRSFVEVRPQLEVARVMASSPGKVNDVTFSLSLDAQASPPNFPQPLLEAATRDRQAMDERLGKLGELLLKGATEEEVEFSLRPLARRLFLSPRFRPVLQERLERAGGRVEDPE